MDKRAIQGKNIAGNANYPSEWNFFGNKAYFSLMVGSPAKNRCPYLLGVLQDVRKYSGGLKSGFWKGLF